MNVAKDKAMCKDAVKLPSGVYRFPLYLAGFHNKAPRASQCMICILADRRVGSKAATKMGKTS
jgi:hypothetical protein